MISMEEEYEVIKATFRSLLREARMNVENEWYPEAIELYEKAFDFGVQFKNQIGPKKIWEAAFSTWEFTYDLLPGDRNYCRCIHVAQKVFKHFNKDEEGVFLSCYLAWLVVREYKPIAGKFSLEDQKALHLLEHERFRYPLPINDNNYLRN